MYKVGSKGIYDRVAGKERGLTGMRQIAPTSGFAADHTAVCLLLAFDGPTSRVVAWWMLARRHFAALSFPVPEI